MQASIVIESRTRAKFHVKSTPFVLTVVRNMEGWKKWVNKGTCLIFEPTGRNIGIIKSKWRQIPITDLTIKKELIRVEGRPKYVYKTTPYDYQQEALDKMEGAPGNVFALFCEPGTGKTKMGIDKAGELWSEGRIDSVIVVAPKGVHTQWIIEQLPIHFAHPYKAYWWKAGPKSGFVKEDTTFYGEQHFLSWWSLNYDALNTDRGRAAMRDLLKKCGNFMMILDESHLVKNIRTKRWKNCNVLSNKEHCAYKLIATGTPIAKDLVDEWAQFRILDENIIGIKYITHFRSEYCMMGGFQGKQFLGPRNLEKFQKITDPYVFRARKKDLPGIPKKVYRRWAISMTKRQAQMYKSLKRDLVAQIDDERIVSVTNILPSLIRLQQISNGYIVDDEDKEIHDIVPVNKNPRLLALEEILNEQEEIAPTIIWCRYHRDIEMILQKFDNAVSYYGAMSDVDKATSLKRWMNPNDKKAMLFVATPGSGGTGLNLQKSGCTHAIYFSNAENYVHRVQSEDRIHRIGAQGDSILYTDIVARGSRDYPILANLRAKKDLSAVTLGDLKTELNDLDFPFS